MEEICFNELGETKNYICETSSIYFSCILKGEADGIIWANRKESPEFLLVWCPYQEGFQLMGQPLDEMKWAEFRNWFHTTIIPFLNEKRLGFFEYGADTKELADMFQNIFSEIKILSDNQKIFHWRQIDGDIQQPKGYQIIKVDKVFLQGKSKNLDFIVDELTRAYGDINLYFKYGIAYVAMQADTVVARADMLFENNGYGNVSVNTEEAHRRKGLSTYLVMKTIEDTCKKGLKPIWDCTEDNIASEKTANKCGFYLIRKDTISWFVLDEYNDKISI